MKEPRYCDILPGNDPWTLEFSNFKKYWNATKDIGNSAARWEECGGKELEYTEWQCSKYKASHYVDYLYKLDGNFSKSLDSCFEKYLKDLPEFKEAESFCGRAEALKEKLLLI
jgi:pterin-4a-carbinolamine dehydratase